MAAPSGPREPGVGAELANLPPMATAAAASSSSTSSKLASPVYSSNMPDISSELDKCEIHSVGSTSLATSSAVSEKDPTEDDDYMHDTDLNLELLRQKVKTLAVRPVEGGDGQQQEQEIWEHELAATVDKLDHLMMLRECSLTGTPTSGSLPVTPKHHSQLSSPVMAEKQKIKMFKKLDPLPLANVSMYALPTYLNSSSSNGGGGQQSLQLYAQQTPQNDLVTPCNEPMMAPTSVAVGGFKSKRKMSM